MTKTYYIGAYWGARQESRAECADRTLQTLIDFQSCHELMASWNHVADSSPPPQGCEISLSREELVPLFQAYEPENPVPLGYQFCGGTVTMTVATGRSRFRVEV